jgi:hypothetical protein
MQADLIDQFVSPDGRIVRLVAADLGHIENARGVANLREGTDQ